MKRFFLYVLAVLAGLIGGAVFGVILGIIVTTVAQTSQFEGKAGYVVFLTFMPLGALFGVIAGPWRLATRLSRRAAAAQENQAEHITPQ